MEKKIVRDFIYGTTAFIVALSGWFYMIPRHITGKASVLAKVQMMPRLAVGLLGIASLVLMVTSYVHDNKKELRTIFRDMKIDLQGLAKQAAFLVLTFMFVMAIDRIGFLASSMPYVFIALLFMGERNFSVRRLIRNAIISIVFTISAFVVFTMVFKVSLPF